MARSISCEWPMRPRCEEKMFKMARLGRLRLLSLVGMISVLENAACDGVDACTQFERDMNRREKECGEEVVESDGYPGGCTDVQARRSACFSDCLESYPSCDALFLSTPDGEALAACWVDCRFDNQ